MIYRNRYKYKSINRALTPAGKRQTSRLKTRDTREGFKQKKETIHGKADQDVGLTCGACGRKGCESKASSGTEGKVKREAWQEKETGRNVGRDKGYNLASHDSAPPSEDENLI